jgi:hypothetical protein
LSGDDVALGIAIVLSGLVAGGMATVAVALTPALSHFGAANRERLRSEFLRLSYAYILPSAVVGALAWVVVLVFGDLGSASATLVLSVVFGGLIAGGLLVVEVGLIGTFRRVPAELGVRLHVAFDRHVDRILPPFTVASILFGVATLVFGDDPPVGWIVAGIVALVAVALISHLRNRPINLIFRRCDPGTVPPGYAALRARWDRLHITRTAIGLAGFVSLVVALLLS